MPTTAPAPLLGDLLADYARDHRIALAAAPELPDGEDG